MRIKAVIDTNVLVSSLITDEVDAPTVKVINYIFDKTIIPLYSEEIMNEYVEVLSRSKFAIKQHNIGNLINAIKENGIKVKPAKIDIDLLDEDDLPFYEVVMEKRSEGSMLVTGNIKHYPEKVFIVTPKEMIELIECNK